ncbi:MAG: hypothetical protein A3F16_07765 [Deltaproteobacteria bacterium RIFCSPHIGHO2_12_FULL_43_9]|nr:MAG: hypothetical protein A3F16_07765 [Deltaproteobacteria bacterium RIFCSPHIGHO2_12_FULL_43_9]
MKQRLFTFLVVALTPFCAFGEDEFPSSARAYLDLSTKEIPGQYDVNVLKSDFASLISQIENSDYDNAKLSLAALLRKNDFEYTERYKKYIGANQNNNLQDSVHGFVTSISFAASKATFELASIVAGGVVHFYPDFAVAISGGEEDNYLFERLLKLALYNAIQSEENFNNIGISLMKIMESRFSAAGYNVLSQWSWLRDNNYMFGYTRGYFYLVDISKYEVKEFPEDYVGCYEEFRLWKWGRFDYPQRIKELRNRYQNYSGAVGSIDTIERLVADNQLEALKELEPEFNNRFYSSWHTDDKDSALREIVDNVEKIHQMGIPFDLRFIAPAPILGCEVNPVEVVEPAKK